MKNRVVWPGPNVHAQILELKFLVRMSVESFDTGIVQMLRKFQY